MKRLRLRVSHRDPTLVVAQGATTRSYKPYAQAFGEKKAPRRAAVIVTAVNCHFHMVSTLRLIERTARRNGNPRLVLIATFARTALSKLNGEKL